jgi:gluconolactonase
MDDPAKELPFQGVYRLPKGARDPVLLTKDVTRPNGIGFSPDEKKLYVASSDPDKAIWMVYDVQEDGSIANGKVFFDSTAWFKEGRPGLPDGLKVDQKGNIFATGPGGVLVFAPDGTHLGTIETGQKTANCGFGGDGSVLYMTADMFFCRIKLNTRGLGF